VCGVAECRSDDDCGGEHCRVSSIDICIVNVSVHCTTPSDTCEGGECLCHYDGVADHWSCGELGGCE
jgi:hypothetical protein